MTLENPNLPKLAIVADLNIHFRNLGATEMLRHVLENRQFGPIALVSSFGADSVVLLHMISVIDPQTPIIFIDTEMLFRQTLSYQNKLAEDLGLTDVRRITPERNAVLVRDSENLLHRYDTDSCCALRKTEPLARALTGFGSWISGRKRYQGGVRSKLELFELDNHRRIKINPLAHWSRVDLDTYIEANNLPRHPLVNKGYLSIGCAPCTTPSGTVGDERAGRWPDAGKTECGIHFGAAETVTAPLESAQVIVNDEGFSPDDWTLGFTEFSELKTLSQSQKSALALNLDNSFQAEALLPWIDQIDLIRIQFPTFSDGRGFSLATQLRTLGYVGRLRAKGHVLADQYAMARRAGFDEVEIDQELASRQPVSQWRARADWNENDYQNRLRQTA